MDSTNGIAANQKQSFWIKSFSLDGINDKLDYGLLFWKVILQDWKWSNYSLTSIKEKQVDEKDLYKWQWLNNFIVITVQKKPMDAWIKYHQNHHVLIIDMPKVTHNAGDDFSSVALLYGTFFFL